MKIVLIKRCGNFMGILGIGVKEELLTRKFLIFELPKM